MEYRVVVEFDEEAGCFSAVCPELPGCCSDGDTEEEARVNLMEAIALYLETEEGMGGGISFRLADAPADDEVRGEETVARVLAAESDLAPRLSHDVVWREH